MGRSVIARLRPRRDRDLIEALAEVEPGDISELVRQGLRQVLQIKKSERKTPEPIRWQFPKG